uniref:Uncharacterized protein n=1 Tax=Anguilla anguilla TaxID=7936 RepID=A0A0E9XQI8_ANGAN
MSTKSSVRSRIVCACVEHPVKVQLFSHFNHQSH